MNSISVCAYRSMEIRHGKRKSRFKFRQSSTHASAIVGKRPCQRRRLREPLRAPACAAGMRTCLDFYFYLKESGRMVSDEEGLDLPVPTSPEPRRWTRCAKFWPVRKDRENWEVEKKTRDR